GTGNVGVTPISGGFAIDLRGTLYLTNAVHFTATGSGGATVTPTFDASTIKLASAWAVEPQAPAALEIGLFADGPRPGLQVTVYSHADPSVVVFENNGGTAVNEGDTTGDSIQVRLSSQPTGSTASVGLGDNGAGLVVYSLTPGGAPITSLNFTQAAGPNSWDT